jgi:CheY-like chemotaxis protein
MLRLTGRQSVQALPGVDGSEPTLEIRTLETGGAPKQRIIAMTANALEGDRKSVSRPAWTTTCRSRRRPRTSRRR